jgi:DNA-binding transcriptional ArsR family regulator
MERTTYTPDVAGLRALAHPLRLRLLGLLRADGASTATALAVRVGESSGTTSYHLRQLAGAGLVVEDEELGNGRERWWRAGHDSTHVHGEAFLDDPQSRAAVEAYLSSVAAVYAGRIHGWLAGAASWPRRWSRVATMSDYGLSLSPTELSRLNDELEQVIESYRRPPRKGDEQVVVQYQSFPRRAS